MSLLVWSWILVLVHHSSGIVSLGQRRGIHPLLECIHKLLFHSVPWSCLWRRLFHSLSWWWHSAHICSSLKNPHSFLPNPQNKEHPSVEWHTLLLTFVPKASCEGLLKQSLCETVLCCHLGTVRFALVSLINIGKRFLPPHSPGSFTGWKVHIPCIK